MAWTSEVYRLPEGHGWTASPGHKILVLDRGAVQLEFPVGWTVEPAPGQVNVRDGATAEASSCTLAVSWLRLPAADWTGLPLSELLLDVIEREDRDRIDAGPVCETTRDGLALAWSEQRVVDDDTRRESCSRTCIARADGIQCLITFDFWPEDEERLRLVWDHVLSSIRLGARHEDPTIGEPPTPHGD